MRLSAKSWRVHLMSGAAAGTIILGADPSFAQAMEPLDIAPQSLASALYEFGSKTDRQMMFSPEVTAAKTTRGVSAAVDEKTALAQLLDGTGLTFRRQDDVYMIVQQGGSGDPQSGGAAGGGAEVEALIVTAQKREEDIQDVPIAISAFTQEALETHQIAGGPDLMTQVPNMTFTKTNFSSYSIQLRGIGTQAISATTDPAVAVAFNNTPFVRNRFFEQEFYDLARVEVLRGPQGTLYGRNATAGVVNIISQKPTFSYEAKLSGDVANYSSTRVEGMVNVPLVEDVVALRLAGAWTKREGFVTNEISGNPIDGRDLWSTRLSLRFAPTDSLEATLIWEHFEEDDDRLRSGKQMCHQDARTELGGLTYQYAAYNAVPAQWGGLVNQGCLPASLYSPDSFEVPNGFSLPYFHPLGAAMGAINPIRGNSFNPYASATQSHDLRVIESTVDPHYLAEADVLELQFSYDFGNGITLSSETAYSVDDLFSTQDYNRFNTTPGAFSQELWDARPFNRREGILEDGVFCDPQIGCADRLVAVDLSTSQSTQFSQEFRIGSDFEGPFNFSLGANFLRHDALDKYYVFINTLTMYAAIGPYVSTGANTPYDPMPPYVAGVSDNRWCLINGMAEPDPAELQFIGGCNYIDPNPIGALNDLGHNYFLSKNPYKLISYAVFGEAYYNLTDSLKVTAGLRWTVDKKEAPRIPSWLLAANTVGYPAAEVIDQEWREPTGRLSMDWKPDLAFTDETLLYASYSRGYKAGGANPPAAGTVVWSPDNASEALLEQSVTAPKTFDPEFVNAYEVGTKNTLLDGRLTLNAGAFYYDYENYQISYIVNRSAVNLNFDAEIWGLEVEADWRPLENLQLGFKGGYENTRVADGESAIDVMDRANGGLPDENGISWIVMRPFPTFPSNCIVPLYTVDAGNGELQFPGNTNWGGNVGYCEFAYALGLDPVTKAPYQVNTPPIAGFPNYPGFNPATAPNNGEGFSKDLSGNELPNAPNFTATITADYTVPLPNDWLMTLHTDLYYQSEAWTRIFNTEGYDKLKAYTNVNLAAIFTNEDAGWKVMAYVKNVLDRDSITGAFLNSDDSGLTTNVFLTEPRLYGLRVTKEFAGGPWWTGADLDNSGPYPLTVELSGQVQRYHAPYERLTPIALAGLPSSLDTTTDIQNRDLDRGDGREARLVYSPVGSPWSISAGMRYGRVNADEVRQQTQYDTVHEVCGIGPPFDVLFCYPGSESPFASYTTSSSSDGAARHREEHTIIDFEVGHDVGLGAGFSNSQVSLGMRHAEFQSDSSLVGHARADWEVEMGWGKYQGVDYKGYHSTLHSSREFSGTGPMLSWAAATRLLGTEDAGHVDLDWTIAGGALFGKHETVVSGEEYISQYFGTPEAPPLPLSTTPIDPSRSRSRSVTVPVVDLSLGLSYEVGRMKLGVGYRWERYFDVLDVGFDEAKEGDRTIDGPYFKLAVGFGG